MAPLIEGKGLYKTYTTDSQPVEVLKGVDIQIQAGEALAILGASGAGKSTLLHLLGTLDHPNRGTVFYDGVDRGHWSEGKISEFRNRMMGFVFQFHHLLPMLTALENAELPCRIAGWSRFKAEERAREVLAQVGLEQRLSHRPGELSGGEQQRVAIARALVMNPRVLFADEPTGNLDSHRGEEIAHLMMELQRRYRTTLVVVTHNEKLAGKFNRRLTLLDGRVMAA